MTKEKDQQSPIEPEQQAKTQANDLLNAMRVEKIQERSASRAGSGRSLYWHPDGKIAIIRSVAVHGYVRALLHGSGNVPLSEFMPVAAKLGYLTPSAQRAFETRDTRIANATIVSLVDILGSSGQSGADKSDRPYLAGLLWHWSIEKDDNMFPIGLTLKYAPEPTEPVWPGPLATLWGVPDRYASLKIATDPQFRMAWMDQHPKLIESASSSLSRLIELEQKRDK